MGGFIAAPLLKLTNPIGYGVNHIARRFTSRIHLWFRTWTIALAFFDYSNCFLLWHCLYFGSCVDFLLPINEIAAILFPNSQKLERWSLKILQRRGHIS